MAWTLKATCFSCRSCKQYNCVTRTRKIEGNQYRVNRIAFTGNTTTPDDVLRREVLLKEGEVFNASSMELSLLRLNQLGLFEEIRIEDVLVNPSRTDSTLDINLRVKEKTR